jgi:formylglycine-generating enzyme required for sulfatase activity
MVLVPVDPPFYLGATEVTFAEYDAFASATDGRNLANCETCGSEWSGQMTAPVKAFEPNAWGLHDMNGNVVEWALNRALSASSRWLTEAESRDVQCRRSARGGAWSDRAVSSTCLYQSRLAGNHRAPDLGCRVLCSSPTSAN